MLGSWFAETGTLPLFEARCVIVLGYSLWRYQFLDFREYTPCRSVRCGIRTKFASGQPKPSDSEFGDIGAIGGWHDGGARYVAALGGDLV